MRRMLTAASWTALAAGCSLCVVAAVWWLHGGRLYTVPSGSMQPAIRPGDAVLVVSRSFTPKLGDTIVYRSLAGNGQTVAHRVIGLQADGRLLTKGDHNPTVDRPVEERQIVGRVQAVAPHLGTVLGWLRRPTGLAVAVYLPAMVTVTAIVLRATRAPTYQLRR